MWELWGSKFRLSHGLGTSLVATTQAVKETNLSPPLSQPLLPELPAPH